MSSSVSFRITRTAEDLAQTITAITERLVKLEQRQEALELQMRHLQQDAQQIPDDERFALDGIDRLLRETRDLLDGSVPAEQGVTDALVSTDESHSNDSHISDIGAGQSDHGHSPSDFGEELAA